VRWPGDGCQFSTRYSQDKPGVSITRSSGCVSVSGRRERRMRVPGGPIPLSSAVCTALAREKGAVCWKDTSQSIFNIQSRRLRADHVFTVHRSSVKLGSPSTPDASPRAGRPGLTLFRLSSITVASVLNLSKRLLFDPKLFWTLASLVVIADVALTQLIIRFVPCTRPSPPSVSYPSPDIHYRY
jgi:hypothetical protein